MRVLLPALGWLLAVLSLEGCYSSGPYTVRTDEEKRIVREAQPLYLFDEPLAAEPSEIVTQFEVPIGFENESWANLGGEADHTYHNLELGAPLALLWRTDTGRVRARTRRLPQPVLCEGRLFVMDDLAMVSALAAIDGTELWERRLFERNRQSRKDFLFGGGLSCQGERVFAVTGFGHAVAMDARTGEVLWREDMRYPLQSAPTLTGDKLLVQTVSNEIVALDTQTGATRWRFGTFEEPLRLIADMAPASTTEQVTAAFSTGEVTSMQPENGRVLWSLALGRQQAGNSIGSITAISAPPVIDRDLVIAASRSGVLVAIDRVSGERRWEKSINTSQMPWAAGDALYVITRDGLLACLSRQNGAVVWTSNLHKTAFGDKKIKKRPIWYGPVMGGGRLYALGSHGQLLALSAQGGELLQRIKLGKEIGTPAIISTSTLFIRALDGTVFAFRQG